MALATLARLHADGLDPEQLKSSQNYMLGQFPPTIETNGQLAARLADMLFNALGPEDVNEFAQRFPTWTRWRFAARSIRPFRSRITS